MASPHRCPLLLGTHCLLLPCWPPSATQGYFCQLPPIKVCVSHLNHSIKGIINLSLKTVEFSVNEKSGDWNSNFDSVTNWPRDPGQLISYLGILLFSLVE
ncbi:unnamed protein product [Rangifer tarandus platyrhynchus]|uniref:Uncharacterized protein n=2 Tax=Rangifer tarandus platyrhynchus TaxID=3082113 RepID=A0AC60A7M1_RANTA|nr:unnamed protein product [Rangifer tarandus platyrhynchus]